MLKIAAETENKICLISEQHCQAYMHLQLTLRRNIISIETRRKTRKDTQCWVQIQNKLSNWSSTTYLHRTEAEKIDTFNGT